MAVFTGFVDPVRVRDLPAHYRYEVRVATGNRVVGIFGGTDVTLRGYAGVFDHGF